MNKPKKKKPKKYPVVAIPLPPAYHKPERRLATAEIKTPSQISNRKIKAFLTAYGQTMDFTQSCTLAGIPVRTMKKLMAEEPDVHLHMAEIEDARIDALERLQFESALENPEDRRWILSRLRKNKWGQGSGTAATHNTQININLTPREMSEEELERIAAGGKTAVKAEVKEST